MDEAAAPPPVRGRVHLTELADDAVPTLDAVLATLGTSTGIGTDAPLREQLRARGLHTLADVATQGPRALAGLPPEVAAALTGQAALTGLSTTPQTNERLLSAGFATPAQIAARPAAEFVAAVGDAIPEPAARAIHRIATAQDRVLGNVLAAVRGGGAGPGATAAYQQAVTATCTCDACTDASSPAAYLADLLDYGVRHLRAVQVGAGLRGEYFAGAFTDLRLQRVDPTVDFDWGTAAPDPSLPADGFSVRWTGTVRPRYSEAYTFTVEADDGVGGVNLWIGGALVVSPTSQSDQAGTARLGSLILHANEPYEVRLEYLDAAGPARIRLRWSSWTQPDEVVPADRLRTATGTAGIDLAALRTRLGQPLSELLDRCDFVSQPVYRARIATEVVRTLFPANQAGVSDPDVLFAIYDALLIQLGTSYGELRRTLAGRDPDAAIALATRLAIGDLQHPGHLDELLLDPADPKSLNEEKLETLFGYASTVRPPTQPDAPGLVVQRRLEQLWSQWLAEDRPDPSVPDTRPLLDPDLIGTPDLVDTTPTLSWPRQPRRPMDLWEDRQRWAAKRFSDVRGALTDPRAGLSGLITDTFVDQGQTRPLQLGLGLSIAQFEALVARQRAGANIDADLRPLHLDPDALELLGWAWRTSNKPGGLTAAEWGSVTDILVEFGKRTQYPTWLAEEAALRISLIPQYFRLRGPDDPVWRAAAYRSTVERRRFWVQTLRRRVLAEQTTRDAWHTAVDETEASYRVEQRNAILRWYAQNGPLPRSTVDRLIDRFQLDLAAGSCQMTTRVEQAIESVQGLLHGARTGLLDPAEPGAGGAQAANGELMLDDVTAFDTAWVWLGRYATWRAALRVFLYPENALRPTLRRDGSPAFRTMVGRLRDADPVDPATAQQEADSYAQYLRDVSSLRFEALGRVTRPDTPASAEPWHLIVARGGHTGKLYACLQDKRPDYWLVSGFSRGTWAAVPELDPYAEVVTAVNHRTANGRCATGLYIRQGPLGHTTVVFIAHDGTGWTQAREAPVDDLVTTTSHAGLIPPAPARVASSSGWALAYGDVAAALDLDGDGRAEILMWPQHAVDGRRLVGLVRELGGGLVLDVTGEVPADWSLLDGQPLTVRTTPVQLPSRRREQLVLVGTVGGQPALGLLGLAPAGTPGVVATVTGTLTAGTATWTINPAARYVAADLTGDGYTDLVAVEQLSGTRHRVTVFQVRENALTLLSTQLIDSTDDGGDPVDDTWHALCPAVDPVSGVRCVVAVNEWAGYDARRASRLTWNPGSGQLDMSVALGGLLTWMTGSPTPVGFEDAPSPNAKYFWLFSSPDTLRPARFGLTGTGTGAELLLSRGAETAVGLIRPQDWRMNWRSEKLMPAPVGERPWARQPDDVLIPVDLDGDGWQELVLVSGTGGTAAVARRTGDRGLEVGWTGTLSVRVPGRGGIGWPVATGFTFVVGDIDGDGCDEVVAVGAASIAVLRALPPQRSAVTLGLRETYGPHGVQEYAVLPFGAPDWSAGRLARIRAAYEANQSVDPNWLDPDLTYLDEAYYYVPVELAIRLYDAGHFAAALDWLRDVYDYEQRPAERIRAYLLRRNGDAATDFVRTAQWLRDPLDPHLVAGTRRDSYTRFTILTAARCLIGAADEEFTRGTAESLARAREFYLRAQDLLGAPELAPAAVPGCADLIGTLRIQIGDDELRWVWGRALRDLAQLGDRTALAATVQDLHAVFAATDGDGRRDQVARAVARIDRARAEQEPAPPGDRLARELDARQRLDQLVTADRSFAALSAYLAHQLSNVDEKAMGRRAPDDWPPFGGHIEVIPAPRPTFCVPPNPVPDGLRRHVELALAKLRDCRNIAGLPVQVEPYERAALATGADGLPSPSRTFPPLPYRYALLVERARQLVDLARQIEQSMLAAIESGERARYEELRARQDLGLARSGVRLRDLQVIQSNDAARASELQRQKSTMMAAHYRDLISAGDTENEDMSLGFLVGAAALHAAAATANFAAAYQITGVGTGGIATAIGSGLSSLAAVASTASQIYGTIASFERREQEWRFQQTGNEADMRIGEQQVLVARDGARIAAEERDIASQQMDNAEYVLDFLVMRRFTTAEMYEWMSALLAQIYRYFLQQATSMAQLAQAQLAFERQEVTPAFIQDDYWRAPTEDPAAQAVADRRGLTGSARLLRDLTELDQYAFRTAQRKLQLTKTISLACLDPVVFQRFRSTGVLPFHTSMSLFDRDFPGHYLRLIRRVRVSVVALVPPVEGVHATLATTGPTRTVVGGDLFQTVVVQRPPESISFTSPVEATGVFELDSQPELLAPFEGLGVEADWEFQLARAANAFAFDGIADVLVTLDYTALDSADHRVDVLRALDPETVGERAYLFRDEFADAWYDLHNPDQVEAPAQPMVVDVRTVRADFPPNLDDASLTIRNVALVASRRDGTTFEVKLARLSYDDGHRLVDVGPLSTVDGVISTRRSSGAQLLGIQGMAPSGMWTISFAHTDPHDAAEARRRFAEHDITDLLIVVTYAGLTPPWPS